jgi:prepilin signal peptidase PulO-like enzyme (type II secretory pathway)
LVCWLEVFRVFHFPDFIFYSQLDHPKLMLLSSLPPVARFILLFAVGAIVGSLINWAIYAWTVFLDRRISPWMKQHPSEHSLTAIHRIPILGWFFRKETELYGKRFWIRPLGIELVWAIGLPLFYNWQIAGGLTDGNLPNPLWTETWFYAHTILLALLFIATFIDFDEKTIPDYVTVSGTLIAFCFAAFAPWFRLPEVIPSMGPPIIRSLTYASPVDLTLESIHLGPTGLWIAMACFAAAIWGIFPKLSFFYVGMSKAIKYSFPHAFRPRRKTKCDIRVKPRRMRLFTKFLLSLLVVGLAAIAWAANALPSVHWESLFSSIVGMAFGAGLVWAVRIIGTLALQKEAMGFGDVTLMGMIGAFFGWQAALMTFTIAPFFALLVVVIQFFISRDGEIAFGPYLCGGALVVMFGWASIWPSAASGVFGLGPFLFYVLAGSLVLMSIMLLGMAWLKGMFSEEEVGDEALS